ncbi:DUF3618 domain-containing protein [Sphingomonas xinjiangensis]|uniref:ElaB/YqjD/DUF883 family membrane-anchored ribosome-binding protein n=1 Tax=Sphingomonas xinjiangensis TaxID=643568 RepID=A0A840YNK4_9SPHN|nr:DUF3618 domain-containing protein [Sphingomonas xinjiangensis]MBB5709092.1 ElaB/YqjD/DUF883 family membrane-anchored ribosome-binding protein [Sphingomonas xinjiangensis]
MSSNPDLIAAQARVEAARARLTGTLSEVQTRLKPGNLAQNAMDSATTTLTTAAQRGADAARARPYAAAGVAGGVVLFLARGWIGKLLRRKPRQNATPAGAGGLNDEETATAYAVRKGQQP